MPCPDKRRPARTLLLPLLIAFLPFALAAQGGAHIEGQVLAEGRPLEMANIRLAGTALGGSSDSSGFFVLPNIAAGSYRLTVSYLGYLTHEQELSLAAGDTLRLRIALRPDAATLDDIVVTGTMRAVRRAESPVPVELYSPAFFRKNPTPNLFEALQIVNGVRPQVNCQICNTGDIHINGLEGPYTMILIDGMPIVSGLATVYGLSGIPNALIDRVEVVRGPASSLYGSEAIGGLINVITKQGEAAPRLVADLMANTWGEYNADLGWRASLGKAQVLTGLNYGHFDERVDRNADNFTDIALYQRVSLFQKWQFARPKGRLFSLAGRYYYEDRWGGEMGWTPAFRGGDEVYGESIYTSRWELMGQYELPTAQPLMLSFSANRHLQNSVYGDTPYLADQRIGFAQLTWQREAGIHHWLLGSALRYTYYDDNTPATGGEASSPGNRPDEVYLPGLFVQNELRFSERQQMLLGLRYDHDRRHGHILTPRFAYKWAFGNANILRLNAGTGFRVVNLFTEDHAALTGAREVVIAEALEPEQSINININYLKKWAFGETGSLSLELAAWHTHFSNSIMPDYDSDPNQIIYRNLDGHATTQGLSANADLTLASGLSLQLGATLQDVWRVENGQRERQVLTERFSGTWALSYRRGAWRADYTGNLYGPMRLPLLGPLDPRSEHSPIWSIQNIQVVFSGLKSWEIYGGVKNLLDWVPGQGQPFLIARAHDPFDRGLSYDAAGQVIATPDNPYALSFDPTYVYAPNQGTRLFLGLRYTLR